MTELTKPISRRTRLLLDNRINPRNRDLVAVTLYPDNTIGFRAYRSRKEIRLHLAVAYRLACVEQGRREAQARKERRQTRREGRRISQLL